MADFTIEQLESMDMHDYFGNMIDAEEMDSYWPSRPTKIIACKFCGKSPLIWKQVKKNDGCCMK